MTLHIIYLAAGNSRRFGSNKLLYPWKGKPMYRWGLEALAAACDGHPDWRIIAVSQYQELLEDAVKNVPSVVPVFSRQSREGISYSIRAGLSAGEAAYYGFLAADQPEIGAELLEQFFSEMIQGRHSLGCVSCRGEDGNPTCFSAEFRTQLEQLTGDCGGKRVMKRYPERIWRLETDRQEQLEDIDVPPQSGRHS